MKKFDTFPEGYDEFKGSDLNNKEINNLIKQIVNSLQKDKTSPNFESIGAGNTIIIGHKYSNGEIEVIVAKNYLIKDDLS